MVEIASTLCDHDSRPASLVRTLNHPSKPQQLTALLRLLYDCLTAEFFEGSIMSSHDAVAFDRIKTFSFYPKIIDALLQSAN